MSIIEYPLGKRWLLEQLLLFRVNLDLLLLTAGGLDGLGRLTDETGVLSVRFLALSEAFVREAHYSRIHALASAFTRLSVRHSRRSGVFKVVLVLLVGARLSIGASYWQLVRFLYIRYQGWW
jgi:hypothetical protein